MNRGELLDKLAETLSSFDDEGTVVVVHITFQDITVGNVAPLHPQQEERWWDENFGAWVPFKPE
jgi:hypothetical protein